MRIDSENIDPIKMQEKTKIEKTKKETKLWPKGGFTNKVFCLHSFYHFDVLTQE